MSYVDLSKEIQFVSHVRGTVLSAAEGHLGGKVPHCAIRRTRVCDMRNCAIDHARGTISRSPWYTSPPESLDMCRSVPRKEAGVYFTRPRTG